MLLLDASKEGNRNNVGSSMSYLPIKYFSGSNKGLNFKNTFLICVPVPVPVPVPASPPPPPPPPPFSLILHLNIFVVSCEITLVKLNVLFNPMELWLVCDNEKKQS